jgi:hypothetical protein
MLSEGASIRYDRVWIVADKEKDFDTLQEHLLGQ